MPAWMEKFITREDVSPDPRRSSGERPAVDVHYTALHGGHKRILGMQGDTEPRWVSVLGAWGSKVKVTRGAGGDDGKKDQGTKLAVIDFHNLTLHPHIELDRPDYGVTKVSLMDGQFDASECSDGALGILRRKETGSAYNGAATWEMRTFDPSLDAAAAAAASELIVSASIDAGQLNGVISIWRAGLSEEAIEQLVLVAVSQIEYIKFITRISQRSAVMGGGRATWMVAQAL
ncbi:uncharacterized protein B0I36DRAFT_415915 [Microdochium trichocladiopsis]|uniref:Uncharacterized protein n=1 Tax=Microdochium trichocladiopsis TaxID=1682393 RepID=A0A9P8XYN8_9PEZI|nr:uncharacterized protein B0I36DRAFT_415915 [Microdochium trichocladiopsis]KAH7024510.1 hypothetical protein B0I36DRAFT_415915 [Microdochium trichocladiopsis]